jgi:hypothetical protein
MQPSVPLSDGTPVLPEADDDYFDEVESDHEEDEGSDEKESQDDLSSEDEESTSGTILIGSFHVTSHFIHSTLPPEGRQWAPARVRTGQ